MLSLVSMENSSSLPLRVPVTYHKHVLGPQYRTKLVPGLQVQDRAMGRYSGRGVQEDSDSPGE